MRNLKRALSLALASIMVLGLMVVGSGASYADVTSEQNQEAIEVLQAVGIMVGDAEGNFNPDANVTRNEIAVIMSNLMDYRVATYRGTSPFTDVPEWAEPYVAACYTNGITSGIGGGLYGGDQEVTTAQAALMMMKALGYFQYAQDFGSDWMLSTVSQANKIDLLVDVDSAVRDPMTRNDMAQLVLNTLEAGTVTAKAAGTISVGGIDVGLGTTQYDYVTSTQDYARAIKRVRSTTNISDANNFVVELGEKLYAGELTRDAHEDGNTDDFERPADTWEYQTKGIGTYTIDANYTWTKKVTSKALYNAVGKTAADSYTWTVSRNGDEEYTGAKEKGWPALRDNKTDDDQCFLQKINGNGANDRTGNGVLTQVYVDANNSTVYVSVMNYYAAEVYQVKENGTVITLNDLSEFGEASTRDEFEAEGFEEDQIVLYSWANDKIQEVYAATMIEGNVSRVKSNTNDTEGDSFTADGTAYSYNKTMKKAEKLVTENVRHDVVGYTDAYGYVAYIDRAAVSYDYAYVLSMGDQGSIYDEDQTDGNKIVYARMVLSDGSLLRAETDEKNTNDKKHIVSYSKDSGNVYTLTIKDNDTSTSSGSNGLKAAGSDSLLKIENGKASFTAPKANGTATSYTANSNTVFVVAESDPDRMDDYSFSVYTGIKNVPDIDGKTDAMVDVAADEDGIAKMVYIQDADVSGTGTVTFIRANSGANRVRISDENDYYEVNAVVDGEKTTLKVKLDTKAAEMLVTKINTELAAYNKINVSTNAAKNNRYIVAARNVTYNADGLVTNVRLYDNLAAGDGTIQGTETGKAKRETVLLAGHGSYAWNDDVVVVRYDYKGAFNVSSINTIKDDENDQYLAVLDDGVMDALCIWEIEDTNPPKTYTFTVSGNSNVTHDAPATVTEGDSVTVTFTAKPGYVFVENGETTITKTYPNVTADTTIEAPAVQEGNAKISLKLSLDDTVSYVTADSKNYTSGKVLTGEAGDVLIFAVTLKDPSRKTVVLFAPDSDTTKFETITPNATPAYVVALSESGTLYVSSEETESEISYETLIDRLNDRVFDLYTKTKVITPAAAPWQIVQFFSNADCDSRDDAWSVVVPVSRWENPKGNHEIEMRALTDMILSIAQTDGRTLEPGKNKAGIAANGTYWSDAKALSPGDAGYPGAPDGVVFERTLSIKMHDADGNPTDTVIGTVSVRYKIHEQVDDTLVLPTP